MSTLTPATIDDTHKLAREMREREDRIAADAERCKQQLRETATLIAEQAGALMLIRTRLRGTGVRLGDWLTANAPNISRKRAETYLRAARKMDERQLMFAALPLPKHTGDKVERTRAAVWEFIVGYITRATKLAARERDKLSAAQRAAIVRELDKLTAQIADA